MIIFFSFTSLYSYNVTEEEFLSYIVSGNKEEVLNYINNKKVNINAKNDRGLTFLILSILHKQNEIAKILIKSGADIDLQDNLGLTALAYSLLHDNDEMSKILIDSKADIHVKITVKTGYLDVKNVTLLMLTTNPEIAKKLIEVGVNIDAQADFKSYMENMYLENITALILAIFNDNTAKAEVLINSGANVNIKDRYGRTALYYAKRNNNTKIVQMLIEKGAE
ncbi:ankyrin repeat domain-containing protein [Brachyspira pulli]|uniref:ankyrin repeat domain-containing protein n=1 Tax=Brachyspira pulli TaxID=310721 RepID=UPI003006A213